MKYLVVVDRQFTVEIDTNSETQALEDAAAIPWSEWKQEPYGDDYRVMEA